MATSTAFRPRTLNERIDYWISVKNWPWMFQMHRLMYQLSGGRLGGSKRGIPVLLLSTIGRRTGKVYTNPIMYLPHGDSFVLVAANAGYRHNPNWCQNLRARPEARVQIGNETIIVHAREAVGEERDRLWPLLVELNPFFEGFQQRTDRLFPVVILEPESQLGTRGESSRSS